MHTLKNWFSHSLAAQALVLFLLGMGFSALFRRDDHPVVWVIQSAVYTAVIIGILARQRRRTTRATGASPRSVAGLYRKIRHREVPQDPEERATMGRFVDDQLKTMERGERWLPYWLGLMGLVAVGLLVLGAATGSSLAFPVVFAVVVAGFCLGILWMRRRSIERYHHMRTALQDHS